MTTRVSRAVSQGPNPLTTRYQGFLVLGVALVFATSPGIAQEPIEDGQITVPSHWSPYQAPTSYPEGTELHIIVEGDTLWDLSGQYLANPFLWPQLWDANRYIENPHLIYPGDPVMIPDVDVVRPEDVEAGAPGAPGAPGTGPGTGPGGLPGAGPQGPAFYPAYEEQTIECAGYLSDDDNRDHRIIGSEDGDTKVGMQTGDIVYLNQGSRDGISPGDRFFIQRRENFSFQDGYFIARTGGLVVLAVQERTSMAEVLAACTEIQVGDYLLPYEPIPVPLLPKQPPPTRMTPESGQMRGEIVASLDDLAAFGEGYLVSIDLGERDGVVPGNLFTIYRYVVSNAPRKVLGELAILTVQEDHATGRVIESYDFMVPGDLVELK